MKKDIYKSESYRTDNGVSVKDDLPLKYVPPLTAEEPFYQFDRSYSESTQESMEKLISLCPRLIQTVVEPFTGPDEILMVFTTTLVAFGPTMPKVFFKYDGRETYPMLMLFISAPPSSGKGVLKFPQRLPFLVQKELIEQSNQLAANYKTDLREAQRQRRRGTMVPIPKEPQSPILVVPGNISSAALIDVLAKNGDDNALLLFELEADAFGITSSKQEFGSLNSTILRSLFHSENISVMRKTDNQHLSVAKPKGAVIFSGTPSQIRSIFQSNQDGLFSRFTFISIRSTHCWKNVFPEESISLDAYFDALAPVYYNCWKYLKQRPVEVRFTKAQESRLNTWGERHFGSTHNFVGEYADSLPKRHVNMMARFATILCMLRYFEDQRSDPTVVCSDTDVDVAEWICEISIHNALDIFKSLPGEKLSANNSKKQLFWDRLGSSFTSADLQSVGEALEVPTKTQYNWIQGFIKTGILERVNMGEYKKTTLAKLAK